MRIRNSAGLMLLACLSMALSAWGTPHRLETNQQYIETINQTQELDIHSTEDVFAYVFKQLPDEVTVYPTENYYYFSFFHNGIQLSGNIRLDALDRDKGIVHFAYFSTYNRWNDELINRYKQFNRHSGVIIKKLNPLRYHLTYRKKQVIFNLNDLNQVRPPIGKIRQDERYLGPVYDESGIQLYLLYNSKIKRFHYILNETAIIPETLTPSKISKDILIGTRTGFSFYRDDYNDRLILIGVYSGNSMVNNYFDGPFDQLPDNFIKGNELRDAFIDQRPELKGKIDRFGNTDNGASRVLITPYIHYTHEYQLTVFSDCIKQAGNDKDNYYRCFKQKDPSFENHKEE